MKPLPILLLLMLQLFVVAVNGDAAAGMMSSGHVEWDTSAFWSDTEGRIEQITALNYKELILDQPGQVWLVMLAKKQNDLCLRAVGIYKEIADNFYPQVRFGFIDVLEDEALKVAFQEMSVPWTFAIFEGRAYKYPALERNDEIEAYLTDLDKWKQMDVQFDVPTGPASKLDIILFDIRKDVRKFTAFAARSYMEWFHEMRTGSKVNFEESTQLGFSVLGIGMLVLALCLYSLYRLAKCTCCRCCRCCRGKSESEKLDKKLN